MAAVAKDLATRLPDDDDRKAFVLPSFVAGMLGAAWLAKKPDVVSTSA